MAPDKQGPADIYMYIYIYVSGLQSIGRFGAAIFRYAGSVGSVRFCSVGPPPRFNTALLTMISGAQALFSRIVTMHIIDFNALGSHALMQALSRTQALMQ